MEILLLIAILGGFIVNILFMRFFFKRLSNKLNFTLKEDTSSPPIASSPLSPFKFQNQSDGTSSFQFDSPSPNQIEADDDSVELNEQNLSGLPKDIRIEVEGGDVHTPPGFDEVAKK